MEGLLPKTLVAERAATSRSRRVLPAVIVVVSYFVLAVLAYRPFSPISSGNIAGATTGDPIEAMWFLEWVPFAIFHGHNPFATNFIDYPGRVNLAANPLASPLGLVASPITLTLGPVATYNLLLRLALASSATSMCFVLRSWTRWWPAAFAGGLLYGFGPYMNEQAQWHLSLAFVPLPPIILWCAYELLIRRQRSPRAMGILLGLLCAGQFLIHAEIFAYCLMTGAVGFFAWAIANRQECIDRTRKVLLALGWAAACCGVVCAYPIWLLLAGSRHLTGPVAPVWFISQDNADLLSPLWRNIVTHLVTATGAPYMSHGVQLSSVQNSDYLGIPLAALIAVLAITQRRTRVMRFAVLLASVSFVLSLGQHLTVSGKKTTIPLPASLLMHFPLMDNIVWYRWALFVTLFASVILGFGLDRWLDRLRRMIASERVRPRLLSSVLFRRFLRLPAPAVLCVIVAVTLIPLTSGYPLSSAQIPWPDRLVSSLAQSVPTGGVVLALPYVTASTDSPMAWQAIDQMHFRIVGGYATVPDNAGNGAFHVNPTKALMVVDLAAAAAGAGTLTRSTGGASHMAIDACKAVPDVLRQYSVDTVVVWPTGGYESLVRDFLKPVLGAPSQHFGQTLVWHDVRHHLKRSAQCGRIVLPRGTAAQGYWRSFSPDCWSVPTAFGTSVRKIAVPGKGTVDKFSVPSGRSYYTFAEISLSKPLDWRHRRNIHLSYMGTGSGKAYEVYFRFKSNEVARYTITDNSDQWRTVSLPLARPGISPWAWSHLDQVGLALNPKSATGVIAIACPTAS